MFIAVVDDSEDICRILEFVLARGARPVRTFEKASDALEAVLDGEVYAVLADIHMPGMDGLELLQHIKERRPDIPVYLMSGQSVASTRELTERGAAGFFEKPVDFTRILATLQPNL